jgi:hypothetical protein
VTRLHLPHPHIADRVAELFERAVLDHLHRYPAIVPDGHDWNEWHHEPPLTEWGPEPKEGEK